MKYLYFFTLSLFCFLIACQTEEQPEKEEKKPIQFNIPEGFVLKDLYSPSESSHGSWVSLAEGPNGIFYACDQNGDIYQFRMPEEGQVLDSLEVDSVDLDIGNAHGMLWAFNSLYVAVNKSWKSAEKDSVAGSGIYRLFDTDQDGKLDKVDTLLRLKGAGEHGPHNFAVGPEGKYLYFIAGNYVTLPDKIKQNSRQPNNWGEDNVFPPYLDARGHANKIKPPGGWIAKFDPEGKDWELISSGFRNPFDLAFNKDGELFTYDADMEWDIGMPWYRPTRVCHVTSGSEFGWRTGSGKWPAYYPDNLPAVINMEQGSPTGILMGTSLNIPARYKNGLFIMDWSFGTIYFIDLKPDGSSYTATKEEFLSGTPLPLTDIIAGSDGNIYFATGGRKLESHLYRLSYKGSDEGEATLTADDGTSALRALRQSIEVYHTKKSKTAIPLAWENLGHPDRFIRYAARIALEKQPIQQWDKRFYNETQTDRIIQAGIALARQGTSAMQSKILYKLQNIDWAALSNQQKVDLLRVYNLTMIRMGVPEEGIKQAIISKMAPVFPDPNIALNRELSQLLAYLGDESATEKIVGLLGKYTKEKTTAYKDLLSADITSRSEKYGPLIQDVIENMPPSEAIFYGMLLSHIPTGWTDDTRTQYFQWFYDVFNSKGGMSFKACMENVRLNALNYVPEDQQKHYQELSGVFSPTDALENLPQPIGPGAAYSADSVKRIAARMLRKYDGKLADGKRAYEAAMCGVCHRMKGEGGIIGPDLTQIHTKFGSNDLAYSIISPNDEISDQYAFTLLHLKNGKKLAGRILSETDEFVTVSPNPYAPNVTEKIATSDIEKQEISGISPMPPGLLNRLNEQEIADLFAYLLSGADDTHEIYQEKKEDEKS